MNLKIISFADKSPMRGKVICFSEKEAEADFYYLDGAGSAWYKVRGYDEWEYVCNSVVLKMYGNYTHWARIKDVFDIECNIPKEG